MKRVEFFLADPEYDNFQQYSQRLGWTVEEAAKAGAKKLMYSEPLRATRRQESFDLDYYLRNGVRGAIGYRDKVNKF